MIQRRGPAQDLRATIDRLPLEVRQAVLDGIQDQRIIAGAHADPTGGVCPMVAADVSWRSVDQASVAVAQEAARAWDRYADASGSSHTATKRQLLALTSMLEASILQERALTEVPLRDAIAEYERARSRASSATPPLDREVIAREVATPPLDREVIARDAYPDMPVGRPRYLSLKDAYEVVPVESPTPFERPAERPSSFDFPAALPSSREVPEELSSVREVPAESPMPIDVPAEPVTPLEVPAARPSARKRRDTGERNRASELHERDGWAWLRPFRSYDEYEETLLRALAELDSHERELEELRVR